MKQRTILLTEFDATRLREVIAHPGRLDHREPEYLDSLKQEMSRAQVVPPGEIPPDVVTMNSTVRYIDVDTGEESECTLVFPEDADVAQGRVSVLAPVGTAILGYREGDTLTWKVPGGERQLRIAEVVYQPEASGDYHL